MKDTVRIKIYNSSIGWITMWLSMVLETQHSLASYLYWDIQNPITQAFKTDEWSTTEF